MKNIITKSIGAILFTGALVTVNNTFAQTVEETTTTTTTNSAGTIRELGPDGIVITSESSTDPLSYTFSKTTTYVDENGNPISIKTVKSGSPVTVYYTKDGDKMVASKVMVRKVVTDGSGTTETITTSDGTISEFGTTDLVITTTKSSDPLRYTYGKTTTYVDENGDPVSVKTVKSGLPVTVYYTKVGNKLIATKVIVRKAVVVPAPVVEEKTKTTTTTIEE